ncbi:MAG: hypothetical protein JSV78_11965 [Phycisphaerales bacterium]|nr:MAG: hypothetical protein JSV78_11965 [Phycisphaerales bacterium]
MTTADANSQQQSPGRYPRGAWLIAVMFLALGALLLADPFPYARPYPDPVPTPEWVVDVATVRTPKLRPEVIIAGYTYRCEECHRLFPSPPETDRPLTQHRDILLEHGINNRCFNCHHRTRRNTLVSDRGEPIPYDQPQLLCAKCHGPVYRDWTHGVHGRTNGYWDPHRGPLERKKCIQCHDPHVPAFQSMQPAPGPRTLRMSEQQRIDVHERERRNPLLIFGKAAEAREDPPGERH